VGWISLGGGALTEILKTAPASWHEIECEKVQPICWSNPSAFFAQKSREQHVRDFDPRAICYMLSNTEVRKFQSHQPSKSLIAQDTFFNYLLERALSPAEQEWHPTAEVAGLSARATVRPATQRVIGAGSDAGDGQIAVCEPPSGQVEGSSGAEDPKESISSAAVDVRAVFERMGNLYKRLGDESISGPGSSLEHTAEIRERLPMLMEDLQVKKLLDAACGDFNWMRHVKLGIDEYLGVDILSSAIARNQEAYTVPGRRFLSFDISRDALPESDLIFCRDCLVHLAYEGVFRVLRNFRRSNSRYLLTTTFVNVRANSDIVTGDWRPLNLQLPPFNLPPPLRTISEKCRENGGRYADKSLGLWSIDNIL
jgi:hypothetical protein